MSTIQIDNGYKETTPKGTLSWPKGEIVIPRETSAAGLELRFTAFVTAAAADAGGMNAAAQQALLEALEVTFEEALSTKFKGNPINKENLYQLMLDSRATLERDAVGGIASTEGLQMALLLGANEVPFTISISLAHLEPIDESRQCGAMGFAQLLDSAFSVKVGAEPLNAADANVTLTKVGLDVRIIPAEDSIGDAEAVPVSIVQVLGGEKNDATGPDGMMFRVDHTATALSANLIDNMDTFVGGKVDTKDGTPEDVQFRFERAPDTSTLEAGLETYRTPLYLVADSAMRKVRTGKFSVDMGKVHYDDLELRIIYKALWEDGEVRARVERRAALLQDGDGEYVHAICTHAAEGFAVETNQAPFTGLTYLTTSDKRFHTEIGLRCKKGGKPFLHVPTKKRIELATKYRMALADTAGGDENTAGAQAVAVLVEYGLGCPAFITSSAGAPPQGNPSRVFGQLKAVALRTLEQLDAVQADKEPPTDLTERELQ